jgi:broad specificity phosphatase PhoE
MKLILVKHSLPQIEPHIPARGWLLSAEGVQRCLPLAQYLADYHPDLIVSSAEPKAIETAQHVAEHLALPIHIGQDLQEHERQTTPFFPTVEAFQEAVARFFEYPEQLVLGEETADAAHVRFVKALTDVQAQNPRKTVAVVTHGTVISLFISRLFAIDPYPFWRSLTLPSFVVLDDSPWQLQAVLTDIR